MSHKQGVDDEPLEKEDQLGYEAATAGRRWNGGGDVAMWRGLNSPHGSEAGCSVDGLAARSQTIHDDAGVPQAGNGRPCGFAAHGHVSSGEQTDEDFRADIDDSTTR